MSALARPSEKLSAVLARESAAFLEWLHALEPMGYVEHGKIIARGNVDARFAYFKEVLAGNTRQSLEKLLPGLAGVGDQFCDITNGGLRFYPISDDLCAEYVRLVTSLMKGIAAAARAVESNNIRITKEEFARYAAGQRNDPRDPIIRAGADKLCTGRLFLDDDTKDAAYAKDSNTFKAVYSLMKRVAIAAIGNLPVQFSGIMLRSLLTCKGVYRSDKVSAGNFEDPLYDDAQVGDFLDAVQPIHFVAMSGTWLCVEQAFYDDYQRGSSAVFSFERYDGHVIVGGPWSTAAPGDLPPSGGAGGASAKYARHIRESEVVDYSLVPGAYT